MYKATRLGLAFALCTALLLAGCGKPAAPQATPPSSTGTASSSGTATGTPTAPGTAALPAGEQPLTSTASQPAQVKWPASPATNVDLTQAVSKAFGFIQNRKPADALALLEPLAGAHNRDLQIALGITEYNNGHLDAAAEAYARAIELDPKYAMAYNNLANVYRDQKKYDLAAQQYQLALTADPKYEIAAINYAMMLESLNRLAWAEQVLRTEIKTVPTSANLQTQLGDLLTIQKKYSEARTAYEAALKIAPGDPGAKAGLDQLPKQ